LLKVFRNKTFWLDVIVMVCSSNKKPILRGDVVNTNKLPSILRVVSILCLLGVGLACNLTQSFQPVEEDFPGPVEDQPLPDLPEEPTPLPTEETAEDIPTASPSPTNTSLPAGLPDENPRRVEFKPGGTSSYNQGSIGSGEEHLYALVAQEGQTMIISVSSSNNDVFLSLRGKQDGQYLVGQGTQISHWVGGLPESQEYLVSLTTTNPGTDYFLMVEIPANINFEQGTDSIEIHGRIEVDTAFHPDVMTRVRYLVHGDEGQTMNVELRSEKLEFLSLGVIGQEDGQRYVPYHVQNAGGEVILPVSQGYYIDVYSTSGESAEFSLEITIN
jgi:hypothetical protein